MSPSFQNPEPENWVSSIICDFILWVIFDASVVLFFSVPSATSLNLNSLPL